MYKVFHYSFDGEKVYIPKVRRKFLFFGYWSSIPDSCEDGEYCLPVMFSTLEEANSFIYNLQPQES